MNEISELHNPSSNIIKKILKGDETKLKERMGHGYWIGPWNRQDNVGGSCTGFGTHEG